MAFTPRLLRDTWFRELNLPASGISVRAWPPIDEKSKWSCVADERRGVLFTSVPQIGKEDLSYFLLAAAQDVWLLTPRDRRLRVMQSGHAANYPRMSPPKYAVREVEAFASEAAPILYAHWAAPPAGEFRMVDSQGNPLVR